MNSINNQNLTWIQNKRRNQKEMNSSSMNKKTSIPLLSIHKNQNININNNNQAISNKKIDKKEINL